MNSCQNSCMILISIQLLYLFHLPGIVCLDSENKKLDKLDKPPKVSKFATLPLVLLKDEKSEYSFPHCFRRSSDGTLVDFNATNEKKETVYFCPKSSEDRLLFPVDGSNYDTCETQPKPMLRKIDPKTGKGCGEDNDLYSYDYKLYKPKEKGKAESFTWQEIYSFCYNKENPQISYLRYRIRSPNLLKNRSLQDIRSYFETTFRLEESEDLHLDAYVTMMMDIPQNAKLHETFMVMELGHPADMIFPNWKKPFYYAGNHALLLHPLKHQWRKIGYFVRKLAEKKLGEIEIITGTAPFPKGELFGTFWKLVIYKQQAIAIILHNIYQERPKKETNVDGNQISETSKRPVKETTISKVPIHKHLHLHPTKKKIKQETSKNESNVVAEPIKKEPEVEPEASKKEPEVAPEGSRKESEVIPEASKKEPEVVDETSTKVTENDKEKPSMFKFCLDICHDMGFGGIVSRELMFPAYCCKAEELAENLGLQFPDKYEVLNLKETPRDTSVTDNDCPTDPL